MFASATLAGPAPIAAAANPLIVLSGAGAALVLMASALIDTWALGGPKLAPLFDRLASVGWVAVWAAGFQGTGLTSTLSGTLSSGFGVLAGMWNAPLFVGLVKVGPQAIGVLALAAWIGCMLPARVKVLGHLSRLEFSHLREFGQQAMTRTGFSRRTVVAKTGDTPPVATGTNAWRRIFPGQINVGMVVVDLLLVTFSTVIQGGVGIVMQWIVGASIIASALAVSPVTKSMGL